MQIEVASENAIICYLDNKSSPQLANRLALLDNQVRQHCRDLIIDTIPSYTSLMVIYDPFKTDHYYVSQILMKLAQQQSNQSEQTARIVTLPVWYHPDSGPELNAIAQRAQMTIDQVIQLHSETIYHVYAIGFAPGFSYLGDVDDALATPRMATPRLRVPAGAVAIADKQTAIYPASSPGGWNIIGLCPTPMFDPQSSPPMKIRNGDQVRFDPIDKQRFIELGGTVESF